MTTHALNHPAPVPGTRIAVAWLRFAVDHFLLLPIGGLIALVWANTQPDVYFAIARPLAFWVNDVGMALFFALIAQEIVEAVIPGGALHTWRRWMLPILAAAGATAASAALYLAYVSRQYELVLWDGWPVATAVDLAFSYMLVRGIFHRHPAVPFVVVLAICTNLIGIAVIASRHPFVHIRPGGTALMLAGIGIAVVMRLWKVRSFWPYILVPGPICWWAFYLDGVNPALAFVPVILFVPHTARSLTLFEDRPHSAHDSPRHIEHVMKYPVQVVLFLFGLVNAGVLMNAYGTGTWAIVGATLVGKPLGMFIGTAVALAFGLHLPRGLHWRDLAVVSLAIAGGFALALFFATAVYPLGPILAELKMGAVLSGVGVPLTIVAAWLTGAGRFRRLR